MTVPEPDDDSRKRDEADSEAEDYLPPGPECPDDDIAVVEGELVSRFDPEHLGVWRQPIHEAPAADPIPAEESPPPAPPSPPPEPVPPPEPELPTTPPPEPPRRSRTARIIEAEKFLAAGNADDALALAQEEVREQPALAEARVVVAKAFMSRGDYAKAQSVLQALPPAEHTGETLYLRGLAALKLNRLDEATKLLESAVARTDLDAESLAKAGDTLNRLRCAPMGVLSTAPGFADRDGARRPRPVAGKPRQNRRGRLMRLLAWLMLFLVVALALFIAASHYAPAIIERGLERLLSLWRTVSGYLASLR